MKILLNTIAIMAALGGSAEAATITVKDGNGTSQTLGQGTDGTNLLGATVICGNPTLATLYSACSNQAIVGANGGLGVNILGASDTNLTPSPTTISAVNNFSTGFQVQNWMNGRTTLTGTPTAGSAVGFTGLAGWNSGVLECTAGGAQLTNQFEVDVSGPTAGTLFRRVATFTGPTASIPINLAGITFVEVVADQWSAGALACSMRVSVNQSVPDDWAVPIQADLDASGNFSSATTQIIAAIPGETIVVNSWDEFTPGSSTSDAKWHFAYGTGTNCGTGTTSKSSNRDFSGSAGLVRAGGGGGGFTVPPGNALCVVIDTAPSTGTVGVDVSYANR